MTSEYGPAVIINCTTGEVTERPLTPEEVSDLQALNEQERQRKEAREAEAAAKAVARASAQTKLAALGLTPEEIAAL
jgi:hypothetical protein